MVPREPRGADGPDGKVLVIAKPQHLRQCNQAQQNDLTSDDTGHGSHDDGHQRCDNRDATPCAAHPSLQRVIHVPRDARAFQKVRHQG